MLQNLPRSCRARRLCNQQRLGVVGSYLGGKAPGRSVLSWRRSGPETRPSIPTCLNPVDRYLCHRESGMSLLPQGRVGLCLLRCTRSAPSMAGTFLVGREWARRDRRSPSMFPGLPVCKLSPRSHPGTHLVRMEFARRPQTEVQNYLFGPNHRMLLRTVIGMIRADMQPARLPPPRSNVLARSTGMTIDRCWAGTGPKGMVAGPGSHSVGHVFLGQPEYTLPSHCREHKSLARILVAS